MAKLVLAFEGKVIRSHELSDGEVSIGRNRDCDIQIESIKVGNRHARVIKDADGQYRLIAETSNPPLLVNHAKASERLLQHGDILQLGAYSLTFSDDPLDFIHESGTHEPIDQSSPPEESPRRAAYLQIVNGQALGRVIPLNCSLTRIGHPGNDTAVVAHRHEGYYISQLEGEHPPQVGGRSVGDQAVLLKDGDLVKLGPLAMVFHIE